MPELHPFAALAVGGLATLTMDIGALLGSRLGIAGGGPRRTGPDLLGRWVGYMARGRFKHPDLLVAPPLPHEIPIGVLTQAGTLDGSASTAPLAGPADP